MRLAIVLLAGLWLAGCAAALPLAATAGAASAATQVPTWISIANDAIYGIKTLTAAEQLACSLQTAANAKGDAVMSYYAGYFCTW